MTADSFLQTILAGTIIEPRVYQSRIVQIAASGSRAAEW